MWPPTDSQWEAVRACDDHVLVEAGAGTGKTFTVVRRILYLLGVEIRGERRATPVTLAEIVAITFTRQAAADLKRDLRTELRKAGRRKDANAVDLARIGTIHGFCSDLVREHTLRCGRTPLTGVLEEGEALAWAKGCVRDELLAGLDADDIAGLDALLGKWDTAKVEQWALGLMRADVLPRLGEDGHSPEECALIELARRAGRRMEARLADEGMIDYDRMIAWTRDLLRDEPGVRSVLQHRIHTLIIDEFQDTDPLQREIAYLLAEPESGRTDTPRLMLVGDPKQSIYRFRGADVTVWSRVRRDFDEHGHGRLRLTDNFRSVPSILSLVEATAGKWLNEPVEGEVLADHEVPFEPVDPDRDEGPDAAVEFIVVPAHGNGKAQNAEARRALEAAAIARRLVELNRAGTAWRDMALLLRTWSSMNVYANALRAAGIPVYALRDDDFLETREVLDLVVALQAIRDPRDDLAVFGFLRSPFVNLRDDTLLAIAVNTRRPYAQHLAERLADSPGGTAAEGGTGALPEPERIAAGIRLLYELAELRDRIPAAALLDELLHSTGYMAHLALLGDRGAQAALNVRRFLQIIGGMEEDSAGMVLRAIAERRVRGDRVPQARLHGEQDDVLLITSIHMAKGLDWPVVIYADLAAGRKPDSDRLLIGRAAIRLGEPDTKAAEHPERWKELRARLSLEEDAEEKRVVYVGLTRPMNRLILAGIPQGTGVVPPLAQDFLGIFPDLAAARDGDALRFIGLNGVQHEALVHMATVADETATTDVATPVSLPAEAVTVPQAAIAIPLGLMRHSATELLAFSRCERRHAFKYVHGIREPKSLAQSGRTGISAIAHGQIVHDVLERYEEEAELEHLLEDAIGRWDENAPPPESPVGRSYRVELTQEITRVLALPEYASIAGAPGARRELTFLDVLADGEAMQGAIDLAAPLAEGVTLVDVKTSRIRAGEASRKAAEYAPQQDVYVSAAAALGPLPVRRFGFVFSGPGNSVVTEVNDDSIAEARNRVRRTVAAMGEVPAQLASNPRECFLCGYRAARMCPGVRAGAPAPVMADARSPDGGPRDG